jgi:hypothetical protein
MIKEVWNDRSRPPLEYCLFGIADPHYQQVGRYNVGREIRGQFKFKEDHPKNNSAIISFKIVVFRNEDFLDIHVFPILGPLLQMTTDMFHLS